MPYDTLLDGVFEALSRPLGAYRSAVAASIEELRGSIAKHRDAGEDRGDRLARELGPFAVGRVDPGMLAGLLSEETRVLPPASLQVLARALQVMEEASTSAPDDWTLEVPAGGDLRDTVGMALRHVGVAFGAARAAELARSGAYRAERHNDLFSGRPFHQWTPGERAVAPPLVVRLNGADLRPAGLADFLDGEMKIVLLVEGAAPPASLARMITPGVTVIQTTDVSELALLGEVRTPGLAAVFDTDAEGVVPFSHDPRGGALTWERLRLGIDLEALGGRIEGTRKKSRRWAEDLAHLVALATPPATGPKAGRSEEAGGPDVAVGVDHLAAWLLATTDLRDVEQAG
jgi:hypothetical protein